MEPDSKQSRSAIIDKIITDTVERVNRTGFAEEWKILPETIERDCDIEAKRFIDGETNMLSKFILALDRWERAMTGQKA
jgi:hypothetical protein